VSKKKKRPTNEFIYINEEGYLVVNLHRKQKQAVDSRKRFVTITSGTQGGKSSLVPILADLEIRRMGQGDYLVATPTFPLFDVKLKGELRRYFESYLKAAEWKEGAGEFRFFPEWEKEVFGERYDPYKTTRIIVGHAQKPDSLESATVLAAFLDEAGQAGFKLGSWYAILRRLSLAASLDPEEEGNEWMNGIPGGRVFITTTPYNLGWLYTKLWLPWDKARKAGEDHPEIDIINFSSLDNPSFSRREWDRAKADLPEWMFDMMYRGLFTRPAGLIYSNWDEQFIVPRFNIPKHWTRHIGLDFGGTNTAAVVYAQDPDSKKLFLYKTYRAGSKTNEDHVKEIKGTEDDAMIRDVFGGAGSENQWRMEMQKAGLPVAEPKIREVEVGITRVWTAHQHKMLYVFEDLEEYIEQKRMYSRVVDELGNPTSEIQNKGTFHLLDAERYLISSMKLEVPGDKEKKKKNKKRIQFDSFKGRVVAEVEKYIPFALRD
jgi:hypothetical protein